jgi:hypothetical protein
MATEAWVRCPCEQHEAGAAQAAIPLHAVWTQEPASRLDNAAWGLGAAAAGGVEFFDLGAAANQALRAKPMERTTIASVALNVAHSTLSPDQQASLRHAITEALVPWVLRREESRDAGGVPPLF